MLVFEEPEKPEYPENQQTQPTHDAELGNEGSHHCAMAAPKGWRITHLQGEHNTNM